MERNPGRVSIAVSTLAACLTLGACGGGDVTSHVATTADRDGGEGHYKVGEPYEINGAWYTPEEDFHYDETGVASWYGPGFHGNHTANGEIFDQNALTAAHPTLQMPTLARVTHLDNGRSVVLRINDRGPFIGDRIIDVSKRAAELLGFLGAGTAEVRVQVLTQESLELAAQYGRVPAGSIAVAEPEVDHAELQRIAAAARGASAPTTVVARATPPVAGPLFVEAGSFLDIAGAERLVGTLSGIGRGTIVEATLGGVPTYRVHLGPYGSADIAAAVLSQVQGAGQSEARIIR